MGQALRGPQRGGYDYRKADNGRYIQRTGAIGRCRVARAVGVQNQQTMVSGPMVMPLVMIMVMSHPLPSHGLALSDESASTTIFQHEDHRCRPVRVRRTPRREDIDA